MARKTETVIDFPGAGAEHSLAQFALQGRPAVLVNLNPRSERNGDDARPAADLKVRVNLTADVLDAFDVPLRWMFFTKNGSGNDLVDVQHDAPNLRSTKLEGPFRVKNRYAGYEFRVHFGDDDDHVVLHDCELNKVELQPMEGGTCVVIFRLQFHPDAMAAGRLAMLVGETVDVTLVPPEHGGEIIDEEEEHA